MFVSDEWFSIKIIYLTTNQRFNLLNRLTLTKMKVLLTAFVLSVFSLTFSGNVYAFPGCTDPEACNYNPSATEDNGTCYMPLYLIPNVIVALNADAPPPSRSSGGGGTPALLLCNGDAYDSDTYYFADQDCVQSVIDADPFCANTSWDSLCQAAYNECCPEANWYIPDPIFNYYFGSEEETIDFLPAVYGCTAPEGYVPAVNVCMSYFVQFDPVCIFIDFDNICFQAYFACAIDCTVPVLAIPETTGLPAVLVCPDNIPSGYVAAESQGCASNVINSDPFCTNTAWDDVCLSSYGSCINGCMYSFACNYNPESFYDDGSCTYPGCNDEFALNYDPGAGCDNGLCVYPPDPICLGDLNGDNQINVSDLTIFLSVYGTSCGIE